MTNSKRSAGRRDFGSIRKLRSGRYQARYRPHRGAPYKTAPYTFRLRSEAAAWLDTIHADLTRGDWVDPNLSMVSFETYATQVIRARVLKPGTRDRYDYQLTTYVFPEIGPIPIGRFEPETIEEWWSTLGHIPATRSGTYRLIRSIFTVAVKRGRIKANPCDIENSRYTSPRRKPGTADEILAAMVLMPAKYRAWVLLACFAGMRRGELAGLRRRQIDVANQLIHIGPTRVAVGGRFVDQVDGKSDAADRPVVVPAVVMDAVAAHLDEHVEDGPNARVFTGVRNRSGPVCVRTLYKHWHRARATIGRPELTMHDLRHSGSTILSTIGGASLAERMRWGGWATPGTAMVYDHATDPRAVEIAGRVNAALEGSNVVDLFRSRPGQPDAGGEPARAIIAGRWEPAEGQPDAGGPPAETGTDR
jgi:integrase